MTLALTFFLSTEMEELLTLREKVESLEGNLEWVERRVIALFEDTNNKQPFIPPEPDEDELVSTCVRITDIVVYLEKSNLHVCIASQSLVGGQNCGKGASSSQYCYNSSHAWCISSVGRRFLQCVHRPTNSPAACTHMHTQPGIAGLREVLQLREDWIRGQAHQQPEEEVEEEGEEEEQVRLRPCVFYPQSRLSSCITVQV